MLSNPDPAPPIASADADRLRGRLMAHALGRLLDRVRGAREVLPHLAALERGLFDGVLIEEGFGLDFESGGVHYL